MFMNSIPFLKFFNGKNAVPPGTVSPLKKRTRGDDTEIFYHKPVVGTGAKVKKQNPSPEFPEHGDNAEFSRTAPLHS